MRFFEMENMLRQIYITLERIEVRGRSNVEGIFCCMTALEQLINDLEQAKAEKTENKDGDI